MPVGPKNRKRRITIEGYFEGDFRQESDLVDATSVCDISPVTIVVNNSTFRVEGINPDLYVIEEIDETSVAQRVNRGSRGSGLPLNPDAYLLLRQLQEARREIAELKLGAVVKENERNVMLVWLAKNLFKKRYADFTPDQTKSAYRNWLDADEDY